ncbi:rab15 effector protein [Chanos chanos]|uniref:Rab15 effector protein n=1 Tax=Chanos chanos TaxID=29144 RepID=A0A6J2WM30_CHACN|nr:rab15 effector protein [Chanos chanos]
MDQPTSANQTGSKTETKVNIFKALWMRPNKLTSTDIVPLFSECVHKAANRTREYLLFIDPENIFQPSQATLSQVFLMTYIQRSSQLGLPEVFNCTTMTPEQRILLGADWVWAVLDLPSKNPRIQVAVHVLHPAEGGEEERSWDLSSEALTETMRMAGEEVADRTKAERLVEFCASVGRDCYALFLFLGRKTDPANIYGVLSNNLDAVIGKYVQINEGFIENFFKGARCFITPSGMLQSIINKTNNNPLTMLIKFT